MEDSIFRTRSLGAAAEGIRDQYADGKAARVWEVYIGDKNSRTEHYRSFLVGLLRSRGCHTILDVACGTGIDSVLLVEEGFAVSSVDASDKMLKYALKTRWNRRKEPGFDDWVIEEANWLTLPCDLETPEQSGFDALICLGNSFAHLPDSHGDQRDQKLALKNFAKFVKPGGILIIDHRNYDHILDKGCTPSNSIYYNSQHVIDIKTSVLQVNGKPTLVTLDYFMDVSALKESPNSEMRHSISENEYDHFRLSYYPHRLESFTKMLKEAFGSDAKHTVYGDFKPLDQEPNPAFYIHLIEQSK